jgi:WD40 repeat protein
MILRFDTFRSLGGAAEIVRAHLERALAPLSPAEQDLAARVFHHLVTPSGTKIAHALPDLAGYAAIPQDELRPVLGELGRARIVRTVDGAGREPRYEIFHDVLAEPVIEWRGQRQLAQERREASRRHRRVAALAIAALVALTAVTAVALFALIQRQHARNLARRAQAREFAAQASLKLTDDPARSVALAARAARLEPSPYVERQLREAVMASRVRGVFPARGGAVTDATMSRDGRRLAIASTGGWVRVVNVETGRVLTEFRHPGTITDVVFSRRGRLLVSAGRDSMARLWDSTTGELIRSFPHRGAVTSLSLSRDDGWLATGSRDGWARVWSLASGEELSRYPMDGPVTLARFSPAADRVAAVSRGHVRVFEPHTGALLRAFDQPGAIATIDFSRRGRLLATAGADKVARIWGLDPPRGLLHTLRGHRGRVLDVAFSPRETLLATASTDASSRIWNVSTGTLHANLLGHRNVVYSARFSNDGFSLITASSDGTARVWNTEGGTLQSTLYGHRDSVIRAAFSPDGARALTWSEDGTARIWDPSVRPELQLLGRHQGAVTSVSFGADPKTVLSSGMDGTARLWRRGTLVRSFRHGRPVADAALNEVRGIAVTGGTDGVVRIWHLDGMGEPRAVPQGAAVTAVALSPDGEELAVAARDGVVRVWAVASGSRLRTLRHDVPVLDVAFDPSSGHIATAGEDGVARIWVGSHVAHALRKHTDDVSSVEFGRRGQFVVTASRDHEVRLWNARTGALVRRIKGHSAAVSDASFSADSRWIVTAGPSRAGLFAIDGTPLPFLRGHEGVLTSAAFSSEGYRIATGGVDGSVRVYTCDFCGTVSDLLRLADARLAEARRR